MQDTATKLETLDNSILAQRLERLQEAKYNLEKLARQIEAEIGAREWEGTWQASTGARA